MPNLLRHFDMVLSRASFPVHSGSTSAPDRSKGVVSVAAMLLMQSERVRGGKRDSWLDMVGSSLVLSACHLSQSIPERDDRD